MQIKRKLNNYSLLFSNDFIKEFIIKTTNPALDVIRYCENRRMMISSVDNDHTNSLLRIAVTEKRTREEIDLLVQYLGEFN